jgi:HD-GYP domain-containing protein (c-di-GMP phosphodiesterase class II)
MLTSDELMPAATVVVAEGGPSALSADLKSLLERAYGMRFTIFDGPSGELLDAAPGQPSRDWSIHAEVCREVARRGRPEFIDDEDPFLTLALPLMDAQGRETVAVAAFLTRRVAENEDLSRQAIRLGMRPDEALDWARSQTPWTPELLKRISDLVLDDARIRDRVQVMHKGVESPAFNLAAIYEKIGLLCRLTKELNISKGVAIQFLPMPDAKQLTIHAVRDHAVLLSRGECPIDAAQFSELIAYIAPKTLRKPIVVNRSITKEPGWPCPQVRQMIAVALAEGENLFGWLAGLNHVDDGEFGAIEASLLSSVAAILDIYNDNIELYRKQAKLLEEVVGALTSAIDAKDPYTCGHSNRVARVAVCLAKELGCDAKMIDTLYLAGQLHDVGKISIDYKVLQKSGKLSEEEYEHVKQHVEIGHHILHDLAKLEEVLPVVLHHHESWDGGGYPYQLESKRIPLAARILAVADAFDAMSSDRPYRRSMPDDQVDRILRAGAEKQWDPKVIDAFFRVRDEIRRICREEQPPIRSRSTS